MATVERFEELEVWQRAEAQCDNFYSLVQKGHFLNHAPLQDQMDRSSASVMDNIAEGFDRYTRSDFRHFLVISRGSNAEFRSQLYRAHKRGVVDETLFNQLKQASEHLGVKLHHFISYLTKTDFNHKPPSQNFSEEEVAEAAYLYEIPYNQDFPEEFIN